MIIFSLESQQQLQESRQQQLREMCSSGRERFTGGKEDLQDLSAKELENLVVDDKHGIIYCYIPKVACTNWKRVMFALRQGEPYQDPLSISGELVHLPTQFLLLNSFPKPEIKARLKHYTKFLFVRHPFVRLISAYRDKFLNVKEYFYQNFARDMMRRYSGQAYTPRTAEEAHASGLHPSFYDFIQYLLDPQTERNEPFEPHWRQMSRLCHPCLIQYDFVGHQENLQDDAEQLLRILGLENIKFPPSYENMTSSNSVKDWFVTVPLEARRELYKLYEADFSLFGYSKPNMLLDE
ncbi:carbohydrate sulfotransferase 12-like [Genypterus blacodes]|uniref:carbohydrate sulfotransferase 12-like n=1 Tax=Genypterus blacodes TaxID=154954 RepID=UPI003F767D0C